MKRLILLVLLIPLFLFSESEENKVPIPEKLDTTVLKSQFSIDSNAFNWYWMEQDEQYLNIIHTIVISNGALLFTVTDTLDKNKMNQEMFEQALSVKRCVDTTAVKFLKEFNYDVKLGSVLTNCLIRNKF